METDVPWWVWVVVALLLAPALWLLTLPVRSYRGKAPRRSFGKVVWDGAGNVVAIGLGFGVLMGIVWLLQWWIG